MYRLEAHADFFRLLMKRIFDPYVLTLARTDLLYMLNWGTQWTMVS